MTQRALSDRLSLDVTAHRERGSHWSIVLAGGEGVRLRAFLRRLTGKAKPKQYCTLLGTRSMLRHTVDRALLLARPEKVLTVIGNGHRKYLEDGGDTELPGQVIEQPANRDTAPGIFLPATYIREADPAATVFIFPSDHFIHPEDRFAAQMAQAAQFLETFPDQLLLVGVPPDRAEADYGWIRQEDPPVGREGPAGSICRVRTFLEKPDRRRAREFFKSGYLWNSMIMVVKIRTLWRLGERHLPSLLDRFNVLRRVIRVIAAGRAAPEMEQVTLSHLYGSMPRSNFSRNLLEPAAQETLVFPLEDVEWSDWGRPNRIVNTIERFRQGSESNPAISARLVRETARS